MKHLVSLFLGVFFPAIAFAQFPVYQSQTPVAAMATTPLASNAKGFATDQYLRQQIGSVLPGTGPTSLGKAEDTAHTTGDVGVMSLGVANTNGTTLCAEGDYCSHATGVNGAVMVDIKRALQASDAGSLLKAEDAAHGSGDSGVMSLGIQRAAAGAIAATGDYAPILTSSDTGGVFAELSAGTLATNPVRLEDVAIAAADAIVIVGAQREDALTTNTGTTGDATPFKTDGNGRLIITNTPPGEMWQACSAAATDTSTIDIKAAVASNRIYVTSITCTNTAAVASLLNIRDGATAIFIGGVSNSTLQGVATWNQTFPVPLRGSVNTALRFNAATTATSTYCCAAGYISVL